MFDLSSLMNSLTDILIYCATAIVFFIGLFKCILPVLRASRKLRRGIHLLESAGNDSGPVWQNVLFLGKNMQGLWRRFLVNAEQLDSRGLNCNVEDYVNDDTVIYSVGHCQLADILPSLLTSLGILGTFIGLVRGLGGLDVSDTAKTMESIPQMIGGMTFAFTTSIVGVSFSLIFNILNRMALGTAHGAIDEFNDAFTDLVMQKPLDENVQMICIQEDRSAFLRQAASDVGSRVSESISVSVERTLIPVAQNMNSFIMGQTQTQIEGVSTIVNQFVIQMNRSLGEQFIQLGQTLSTVNQAQTVSMDSINRTMAAADRILSGLNQVQTITNEVMQRFDVYVSSMEQAQGSQQTFLTHGNEILSGMVTAANDQTVLMTNMRNAQNELQQSLAQYASIGTSYLDNAKAASGALDESSRKLSGSYASFVDQLSQSLNRSLADFTQTMDRVLTAFSERVSSTASGASAAELSGIQRALKDVSDVIPSDKDQNNGDDPLPL